MLVTLLDAARSRSSSWERVYTNSRLRIPASRMLSSFVPQLLVFLAVIVVFFPYSHHLVLVPNL